MIEEYTEVVGDQPQLLRKILGGVELCYPLTELDIIRHKPDNRFLECALAVAADFIVTVNTARGHFDRSDYQGVCVATPGEFVDLPVVRKLICKHLGTA